MSIISYTDLFNGVKDKTIKGIILGNKITLRLFVSTSAQLCRFNKRSSRMGALLEDWMILDIVKVIYTPIKDEAYKDKQEFTLISKYRKMAMKASFTNNFIEQCKTLPVTFEQWVAEGKKGPYGYSITTGNCIDGKVISIDRILKAYPNLTDQITKTIQLKTRGTICNRYPFAGYEMSISSTISEGDFQMFLSIEYKDCGNGYYYLLINDKNFIGYDVD